MLSAAGAPPADGALERLFSPNPAASSASRPMPDWEYVHRELRKKGVTKILLWQEYRETCPDGYQLTQFYELYNRWRGKLDLVMRQEHRAGEKLFVDYAGQTVPIIVRRTGEILFEAQIFVAAMGASNYSYAEATRTQTLPDWIGAHVRTFAFLGGVTEIVVPDYVAFHIIRLMCPSRLCALWFGSSIQTSDLASDC